MAAAPTTKRDHVRIVSRGLVVGLVALLLASLTPTTASAQDAPEQPVDPEAEFPAWLVERAEQMAAGGVEQAERNIVNGSPVSIESYPWQVQIAETILGVGQYCGGTLLAAHVVLTAAHCVDLVPPEYMAVIAGTSERNDAASGQWSTVQSVVVHPSWVPAAEGEDLGSGIDQAVIILDRAFTLNQQVSTIPLVTIAEAVGNNNRGADYTGWGVITSDPEAQLSQTLRVGEGKIKTGANVCISLGVQIDVNHEFCVDGSSDDKMPCTGDSGGPVAVRFGQTWKLVGITSWANGCDNDLFVASDVAADWLWLTFLVATPQQPTLALVSGRVFDDVDGDGIEDPLEVGVPGIEIELVSPGVLGGAEATRVTAQTDGLGSFLFTAQQSGYYYLEFELPEGFGPSPTGVGAESTDSDFALAEGGYVRTETFRVDSIAALADLDAGIRRTTGVGGVIFEDTDLDGDLDSGEGLAQTSEVVSLSLTNVDGSYSASTSVGNGAYQFHDVPAGAYRLSVTSVPTGHAVTRVGDPDQLVRNDFSPFTVTTSDFVIVQGDVTLVHLGLTPSGLNPFVDVANTNCDGSLSIVDALVIAQYAVGVRSDVDTCPVSDPANEIRAQHGDINLNGRTDIVDALLVAQCAANLQTVYCREPSGLEDPNGGTQGSMLLPPRPGDSDGSGDDDS